MINKKYFIVPGFPKCGTTWLYDRLNELPDFQMPPHKELHYFNRCKRFKPIAETGRTQSYLMNRKRILRNFGFSGFAFFVNYLNPFKNNDQLYVSFFNKTERISGDITPL